MSRKSRLAAIRKAAEAREAKNAVAQDAPAPLPEPVVSGGNGLASPSASEEHRPVSWGEASESAQQPQPAPFVPWGAGSAQAKDQPVEAAARAEVQAEPSAEKWWEWPDMSDLLDGPTPAPIEPQTPAPTPAPISAPATASETMGPASLPNEVASPAQPEGPSKEELIQEIERLRLEVYVSREQGEGRLEELKGSQANVRALEGELEGVREMNETLRQNLEGSVHETIELRRQLEASAAEVATLKQQLEASAAEVATLKQQLEASSADVLALNQQLEEATSALAEADRRIEEGKARYLSDESVLRLVKASLHDVSLKDEEERKTLREENEHLSEENALLRKTNGELLEQVSELSAPSNAEEIAAMQKRHFDLEGHFRSFTALSLALLQEAAKDGCLSEDNKDNILSLAESVFGSEGDSEAAEDASEDPAATSELSQPLGWALD